MNAYLSSFAIAGVIFLLAMIIALRKHYRKIIREKDRAMIRRINEYDCLHKQMDYIRMEKNVLEKLLKSKTDSLVWETGNEKGKNND
jgi:uncharacterized membrane protein YhiD involved in acid resistance